MAAIAAPAADLNIVRQQLTDLRKAYKDKLHVAYTRPYFAIALLVASTAMLIFGSAPLAILGIGGLFVAIAISRVFTEAEVAQNRTNRLALDRLAVPGFFEFCRTDARRLQNATSIEAAFADFMAAPRPL